jgi:RNA polymerase sigma-70 factor (ECF subfamily)
MVDRSVPNADKAEAWRQHGWSLADLRFLFRRTKQRRDLLAIAKRMSLFDSLPWSTMFDGDPMIVFNDPEIPKAAKESAAKQINWVTINWALLGATALLVLPYVPEAVREAAIHQIDWHSMKCTSLKDGQLMAILAIMEILPPDVSRKALDEILTRHYGPTMERLKRTIQEGSQATANEAMEKQDAVQETFLKLLEKARTFDFSRDLKAWLNTCFRNWRITTKTKENRERPIDPEGPTLACKPDRAGSQKSSLDLEVLPEDLRKLVKLRLEGNTLSEISSKTDLTIGQVYSRLEEAYDLLRQTEVKALLKDLSVQRIALLLKKLSEKLRPVVTPLLPRRTNSVPQTEEETQRVDYEIEKLLNQFVPLLEDLSERLKPMRRGWRKR